MTPRTIVHAATFLQGGAGRAIVTLACAQQRSGARVIVATSRTPEPGFENYGEYINALRSGNVDLIEVDSLFKRDDHLNAQALATIQARLDGMAPDLVHAHAAIPARIGRRLGAPVVQTMHGWSRHKSTAHVAEDLSIMREVDAVVFPSGASHTELDTIGAAFRRSAIIPYGIPAAATRSSAPDLLAAFKRSGRTILLSIGSLTDQKNHAVLIEALPFIAQQHDVMCFCVGEGPNIGPLSARARELEVGDRVSFTGYLSDAASALGAADLLIQPSLTESFGIAVVEAFRAGVPVVASNIPALRELVGDTKCGWMFDPASPASLCQAVHEALSASTDRRTSITQRATQLFEDRFTDDRMIAAYDTLYQTVIA